MKQRENCRNRFLLEKLSLLFTQRMNKRSNLRWEETTRVYGGARSLAPAWLVVAARAGRVHPAQPRRPHRRCRVRGCPASQLENTPKVHPKSIGMNRGEARANLWGVHHCTIFTVSMMIYWHAAMVETIYHSYMA